VKKLILAGVTSVALAAAPGVAASPTFRLAIVHAVRGCHVWSAGSVSRPAAKISLKRGTRLEIRISCPMDFDFSQTAGPKLDLRAPRTFAGTTRTIVFRKAGVYKLTAKNVQTSEEMGLQTLGPDNVLTLTVVVS
jgi:hypothetical protein